MECPALLDAGLAYSTEAACCKHSFGDAGCGKYCFVKDEAVITPHRQCKQIENLGECDKRRAAGRGFATYADCCTANFGEAGCATFPAKCYAADTFNLGRCMQLDTVNVCAGYMDRGAAWKERKECCAANKFHSAACQVQATCWVVDASTAPHRSCKFLSADDCPQRLQAGDGWGSREECCDNAFGPGKACREFPKTCYEVVPNASIPFDSCRQIKGLLTCATALDKRPDRVFDRKHDCCAAALPGVWVNYTADVTAGCQYAPDTCWSPPLKPVAPHRECFERQDDAQRCARDVTHGNKAWGTRLACCRGAYGRRGCRRYPDSCWVKMVMPAGNPDRECQLLKSAAACAAKEDAGLKLYRNFTGCCSGNFGGLGCRTYPAKCYGRRTNSSSPDRVCVTVLGKAACKKELERGTGNVTYANCCKGFRAGCKTYPTTCYTPEALEKTLPDRVSWFECEGTDSLNRV